MPAPRFGLLIIGDEILSGKRQDKHLAQVIELLGARGHTLAWARYVGDERAEIAQVLREVLASSDVVFSCGGIGATPDDHTRQAAALALGVELQLHPQARSLIEERMRDVAREQGLPYEPERADNLHRLHMGEFPQGAQIIENPYNKIPGFAVQHGQARVYFVPGFPVMAWPMIAAVLDAHYPPDPQRSAHNERSVIVLSTMESTLTPLMEAVEARHPAIKVFSLPSVDHPDYGRHIELGVKGPSSATDAAYADLHAGLQALGVGLGPSLRR